MNDILSLSGVVKLYGDVRAVNGADMCLDRGERILITGGAGAGKTTLARLICGMERPDGGNIRVLNKNLGNMSVEKVCAFRARHIGLIASEPVFWDTLTLKENAALPLACLGIRDKKRSKRVIELFDALQIRSSAGAAPLAVPRLKRCLASIARAFAASPELIIADDLTAALSAKDAEQVLIALKRLCESEGCALIYLGTDERPELNFDRQLAISYGCLSEVHI